MKYTNPWPPVNPQDEKIYDIELEDGVLIENVEFWAFGGGFEPSEEKGGTNQLTKYPLHKVVSFSLATNNIF